MDETPTLNSKPLFPASLGKALGRVDKAWATIVIGLLILAIIEFSAVPPVVQSMLSNLAHTLVFVLFAVFLLAWLRATGAESLVGRAFQGREYKMIILASLVGGLAPFCSCEVIPFVAALLAIDHGSPHVCYHRQCSGR